MIMNFFCTRIEDGLTDVERQISALSSRVSEHEARLAPLETAVAVVSTVLRVRPWALSTCPNQPQTLRSLVFQLGSPVARDLVV